MNDIVQSVRKVADVIGEITAASGEQSAGISEVNQCHWQPGSDDPAKRCAGGAKCSCGREPARPGRPIGARRGSVQNQRFCADHVAAPNARHHTTSRSKWPTGGQRNCLQPKPKPALSGATSCQSNLGLHPEARRTKVTPDRPALASPPRKNQPRPKPQPAPASDSDWETF